MPEFVYTLHKLRKALSPERVLLDDITLAFFPGAKIGVLGPNGSGKSTLAQDHGGRRQGVHAARRVRRRACASASCRKSRSSTARKRSSRSSRKAWPRRARCSPASKKSARSSPSRWTTTRCRSCSTSRRDCKTASTRATHGSSTARSRSRWTRCACRRATRASRRSRAARSAASRSAGCCSRSPRCCCSTSRPTTSTRSRSRGSSTFSSSYPGTVVAVTHDRYFLDNIAGWILELDRGRGYPFKGNYTALARAKEGPARQGREASVGAPAHARPRAPVDPDVAARAASEVESAHRRVRDAGRGRSGALARDGRDQHPARPAPGHIWSSRPSTCARATATGCSSTTSRSRFRPAASSASSARTAPARRRCFA